MPYDSTTTLRRMIRSALDGRDESPAELTACFYQARDRWDDDGNLNMPPVIGPVPFAAIPEPVLDREFDSGYGGQNGDLFIGYTTRFVYVTCYYDGSEWISTVPRNPSGITDHIPEYGGG